MLHLVKVVEITHHDHEQLPILQRYLELKLHSCKYTSTLSLMSLRELFADGDLGLLSLWEDAAVPDCDSIFGAGHSK